MNVKFAKVLALVMVLALVLSGCNLIEIDPKMQADEDIAKIQKAHAKVVASYDGGEVTVGEVMGDFNAIYNETAYMYYYYFGYEMPHEEVHALVEDVLAERVRTEIAAAKFDAEESLTDAETAQLEAEIQAAYESNRAGAMEIAEGKTEEARSENTRVLLYESGVDYDTLSANMIMAAKRDRMQEKLRGEITEVSEEALQAAYAQKVAQQQSNYTDGFSFESDMSSDGVLVCWQPDGYRTVKHILVMPDEETKTAYSDAVFALEMTMSDIEYLEEELAAANDDDIAEGDSTPEEIQAELDAVKAAVAGQEADVEAARLACLESVKDKTDAIYARLEAGEDFEALIAEYGEDPGMQNEPTQSRGYYVSAASQNWEENFRDAAMALEQVGQYTTEPVVSGSGVHIIQYTADVLGGEVDMSLVRDALEAETLEDMQDAHIEETMSAWAAEANPSYDVEGFEAAYGAAY